ncbi:MAG: dihydrofolate reductase [Opitutae bacterium]|nr:dihydrofolate reductase [Opitutae bacterium]
MTTVTYSVASSIDGYIATEAGSVDWLTPFQTGEDRGFLEFYSSVGALLMGRRAYEFALTAPAWPSPDKLTWVFTQRPLRVIHPSITLTSDSPAGVMRALAAKKIKHAWLMGGGRLAASFRSEGLISRYVISVMPVLLGRGIPLFEPDGKLEALTLVSAVPFKGGVVQLTYEKT